MVFYFALSLYLDSLFFAPLCFPLSFCRSRFLSLGLSLCVSLPFQRSLSLSFFPSASLYVCLVPFLSVSFSLSLSIYIYISFSLCLSLSISLSLSLSVFPFFAQCFPHKSPLWSASFSVSQYVLFPSSLSRSVPRYVLLSFFLSVCLSFFMFVSLSLSFSFSFSLCLAVLHSPSLSLSSQSESAVN